MIHVDHTEEYPRSMIKPEARRAGSLWCHMWDSDNDEKKLVAFAVRIGLRVSWMQKRPGFPHFDLTPRKRRAAILHGAIEKDLRDWLRERRTADGVQQC